MLSSEIQKKKLSSVAKLRKMQLLCNEITEALKLAQDCLKTTFTDEELLDWAHEGSTSMILHLNWLAGTEPDDVIYDLSILEKKTGINPCKAMEVIERFENIKNNLDFYIEIVGGAAIIDDLEFLGGGMQGLVVVGIDNN